MAINTHALQAKLTSKEFAFLCFLLVVVFVYRPGHAHAATIDVAAGSSLANPGDNICQINEAIENVNSGTRTYADCIETGSYGSNDTINLPIGTITGPGSSLTSVYKYNNESLKFVGQGRGQSILDGAGLYLVGDGNYTVQDLTMTGYGVEAHNSSNLTIKNVEIDLLSGSGPAILADASNVDIQDSYFHSMLPNGSGYALVNFEAFNNNTFTMNRTTLSDAGQGLLLLLSGSGLEDAASATITNSTFTDLTGLGGLDGSGFFSTATGISAGAITYGSGSVTLNYTTTNNTFSNITNSDNGFVKAAAIREASYFEGSGAATVNHTAHNDLYAVGNGSSAVNYNRFDISALLGSGSGSNGSYTTTSNGGNVSSDNSFASYLTNPMDKHNETSLASFLGVLTDNGGSAPTLALTEGSPAIDAGTNVGGMTTDQRGATRPQGNAFDAGAYESAFSVAFPTLTYPDPIKGSTVTLVLPGGVTNPTVGAVNYTTLPKDGDNKYPAGLTTFTFTTTPGATKAVTLYYDLPGSPADYTARKYNTTTKLYSDIPGATITREDYNGKSMLKLTYSITDGGILDQDGTVNGTIVDPVGLATTNLADTGMNAKLLSVLAAGLLALATSIMVLASRLDRRLR
ncbi:MAG: choice-of-anchor Q domain-containing protein [Candidatus Saccharibacteria bacterium]